MIAPPHPERAKRVEGLRFPCTGPVATAGFSPLLTEPRANLRAFATELRSTFSPPRLSLVNSGSSANLAAALALAERAGKRRHAVASAFTFPTTLSSLLTAGFEVTLADVSPGGFNLSPDSLRRAMRPDTGLVCVTHFLGFPAPIDELAGDLLVLQDACETMDARVANRPVFSRGTLTTWSFYHPHHLSSFGGGAVISLDEDLHRAVESIAHWGRACTCHVDDLACRAPEGAAHQFTYVRPGHNLEMSELNAAFGRFQLARWSEMESARKSRYAILYEALADSALDVWAPPEGSGSPFVFPFAIRSGSADAFSRRLAARGVESRTLMGGPIADQPAFRTIAHDGLANARALSARALFVGIHQTLPLDDVHSVAAILLEESR